MWLWKCLQLFVVLFFVVLLLWMNMPAFEVDLNLIILYWENHEDKSVVHDFVKWTHIQLNGWLMQCVFQCPLSTFDSIYFTPYPMYRTVQWLTGVVFVPLPMFHSYIWQQTCCGPGIRMYVQLVLINGYPDSWFAVVLDIVTCTRFSKNFCWHAHTSGELSLAILT